jgi:hypothetical protein
MLAIVELIIFLLVLPYVLFGLLLGVVVGAVGRIFEPRILLGGIWLAVIGLFLLPHRELDASPFATFVDVVAQSHVLGLSTPVALLAAAGVLICVAVGVRLRLPADGPHHPGH